MKLNVIVTLLQLQFVLAKVKKRTLPACVHLPVRTCQILPKLAYLKKGKASQSSGYQKVREIFIVQ